jgi:cell division protein FtsW
MTMYGSPYTLIIQHLIGLGVGIVAMIAGMLTPPKLLFKASTWLYVFSLLLLALVFVPGIGLSLNGAHRWLLVGGISIQPVEFFKLALIIFMSSWLVRHQKIGALIFTLTAPIILLLLQPDLGSLLVVIAIACSLFIVAGGSVKHLGFLAALGVPLMVIAVLIAPYRFARLTTFINPESDPQGAGFHVRQITLALGRGGLFGQGLGNSSQKFSYVPEASTDSIAAIIGEETGFVGLLVVIGLFVGLCGTGYRLLETVDGAYRLLGLGILIWIVSQALLNLAAVVALVPLTGVPLPFISYGRSSFVMLLYGVGLFLRLRKTTS